MENNEKKVPFMIWKMNLDWLMRKLEEQPQYPLTIAKPGFVYFSRVEKLLIREDHLFHPIFVFLCLHITLLVLYLLQLLPLVLFAVVPEVQSRLT